MRLIVSALILAVMTALPLTTLTAAPVAEEDRIPVDLRRTTLVVRDMEKSLAFYRDGLGLKVIYDQAVNTPRGASDEDAEIARRLIFLRSNDDFIGIIGLLEYKKPRKPEPKEMPVAFGPGTIVFVFNTNDVMTRFERMRKIDGVVVIDEPAEVTYPSYDGTGTIPVLMSAMSDPDGHVVELNQFLEGVPDRE